MGDPMVEERPDAGPRGLEPLDKGASRLGQGKAIHEVMGDIIESCDVGRVEKWKR